MSHPLAMAMGFWGAKLNEKSCKLARNYPMKTTTIKCPCGATLDIIAATPTDVKATAEAQGWRVTARGLAFCPSDDRAIQEIRKLNLERAKQHGLVPA